MNTTIPLPNDRLPGGGWRAAFFPSLMFLEPSRIELGHGRVRVGLPVVTHTLRWKSRENQTVLCFMFMPGRETYIIADGDTDNECVVHKWTIASTRNGEANT